MKPLNIVLFGVGNVGSTLIKQILADKQHFHEAGLDLNIPVIVNSRLAFFEKQGIHSSWESDFASFGFPYELEDILNYVKQKHYENLVAVDATASSSFVDNYERLVEAGFHIVAANKVANSLPIEFYEGFRKILKKHKKQFLYETNVGAGLPIIQTLQGLYQAGEKITKVRGVFSGSLSYIFNTFSEEDKTFAKVLEDAQVKGFTEPDPRVDLSGKDVGRKLLILARELNLKKELADVKIEDLVPARLNGETSLAYFKKNQDSLNPDFQALKNDLESDEVLRHVGELDLVKSELQVKLVKEKKASPLGNLKNADASFEIFTESYGEQPIVIQGAGAGAAVTARGVLADLIKLAQNIQNENSTKKTEQRLPL